VDGLQTLHQTLRVILALIKRHETNHAPQDAGAEGIRVAFPATRQHGQGFFVEVCAVGLVFLKGGADADDLPRRAIGIQTKLQSGAFGGIQECDGLCILADQCSTKRCASSQRPGNAGLFGKEDGFLLFRQPGVHLADDGEVVAAVHSLSGHNGVLTIEHEVMPVPIADLGRVGDQFGELSRHLLNIRDAQTPLVVGRDFEEGTVDDLFYVRPLGKEGMDDGLIGDFGGDLRHGAGTVHIVHSVSSNFCR